MPLYVEGEANTHNAAPAAAAGANAGTSPPAPVVTAGSTDLRGQMTFGTGTSPAAGAQVAVTFNMTFSRAPVVILTPANAVTAALNLHATSVGTTGFTLSTQGAPAASQGSGIYSFYYAIHT